MIMDIVHQVRGELKMSSILDNNNSMSSNNSKLRDLSMNNQTTLSPSATTTTTVTKKRSFDVAFLMQPDEKLQAAKAVDYGGSARKIFHSAEGNISIKADALLRQLGSPYSSVVDDTSSVGRTSTDSPTNEEIDIMTNGNSNSSFGSANPIDTISIQESVRYFRNQVNNARNNNSMMSPRVYSNTNSPSLSDLDVHRSAFTKVPQVRLESPAPLSPDRHSCPSISPPPIATTTVSTTPPRQFANFRCSDYGFPQHFSPFLQQPTSSPYVSAAHMGNSPGAHNERKSPPKPQYFYRPIGGNHNQIRALEDLPPNGYLPQFQMMGSTSSQSQSQQMHPFPNDLSGIVRHPAAAAAILSTLIPPTIASSFSMAAQNICAKCNISFRMTSDLVYHMRSHHKSENITDTHRRKREEKLKCPVCNESFRERHHLTRHMTAHQDKESDDAEPPQSAAAAARNHQLMANAEFMGSSSSSAKGRQHHHHHHHAATPNGLLQINQQQHNKSH